jgi:Ca-activated chloride channel family protein
MELEKLRLANMELTDMLLVLAGVTIVLSVLFVLTLRWKKNAIASFGDPMLISALMPDVSSGRPVLKFFLLLFASWTLVIGIANPQIGSKIEEVKREGVDLMIALDLSKSMLAEDIKPNRLERSKQAISKLIDKLKGDRIGLIVFGGEAFVQLPITTDYAAAKLFLSTVGTDIMPSPGTAIGDAIELGLASFGKSDDLEEGIETNKAIIVITDGENHIDDAIEAAEAASEKGVVVHTIGMGLTKGGPIPIYRNGIQVGYRKDKEGNAIITKLNETMLQQIAAAGDGTYIRANNLQTGLSVLFTELNKMEKVKFGSKIFTDYEDRFQYFLALAIFFLILEFFVAEKKNKYLRKIKLFE